MAQEAVFRRWLLEELLQFVVYLYCKFIHVMLVSGASCPSGSA